ncbi:MAG: hypothetical protein LC647_10550 [Beggiatoa sp.]|nr:hypothetical protein [Beggiatoa sp.]
MSIFNTSPVFVASPSFASETMHAGVGPTAANIAIGVLSAVIDNIPLMFAVLTVNPAIDPGQWLLITLAVFSALRSDRRAPRLAGLSYLTLARAPDRADRRSQRW